MEEKKIGTVMDFFAKIGVIAIALEDDGLRVGDTIHIKGATSDFTETVTSMQIERESVNEAKVGDNVGIKAKERARKKDVVYKVIG